MSKTDTTNFDPAGFSERLQQQLEDQGIPVKALQRRVRKRTDQAPATSYGSIWSYVNKPPDRPRPNIIAAIAAELGVRKQWLCTGEGGRTEQLHRARLEIERAGEATASDQEGWRDVIEEIQEAFGTGGKRLRDYSMILLPTWYRLWRNRSVWPPSERMATEQEREEHKALVEGLDPGEPPRIPMRTAASYLGRAIRDPLLHLAIDPDRMSDDDMLEYITMMCAALRRLAAVSVLEAARHGDAGPDGTVPSDLSDPPEQEK